MEAQELAQVYERYGHIVIRICREILRHEQDAQDAKHETFLKFWGYADKLRKRDEVFGSLRRTAISCAIDLLRSRKRRGRYHEAWSELRDVMTSETEQSRRSRAMDREVVALLFRAVRVDQATLEMAYLYYMDDLTLEEVATETGYSRRAVGMKLERFRTQARKYCRNHGITL